MSEQHRIERRVLERLRNPELWCGSDYELAIQLRPQRLDTQARLQLLQATWGSPKLTGVVLEPGDYGDPWLPIVDSITNQDSLYGCILLGSRHVGCRSVFLEYSAVSWLLLSIPMAMLELVFNVDYAVPKRNRAWMAKLGSLLAQIGAHVYSRIPFEIGMLGEEASAGGPIHQFVPEVLVGGARLLVPEPQFRRAGVAPVGVDMGGGLWWVGG